MYSVYVIHNFTGITYLEYYSEGDFLFRQTVVWRPKQVVLKVYGSLHVYMSWESSCKVSQVDIESTSRDHGD